MHDGAQWKQTKEETQNKYETKEETQNKYETKEAETQNAPTTCAQMAN